MANNRSSNSSWMDINNNISVALNMNIFFSEPNKCINEILWCPKLNELNLCCCWRYRCAMHVHIITHYIVNNHEKKTVEKTNRNKMRKRGREIKINNGFKVHHMITIRQYRLPRHTSNHQLERLSKNSIWTMHRQHR